MDVSEDIIDYLKQQQLIMKEKIDQSQFKFVDEFHLTLLFLGEQSEDEMKRINQALDTVSFESFDLKLTTTPVGSPECGLLNAGAPRLAQKYMLPSFAAGG